MTDEEYEAWKAYHRDPTVVRFGFLSGFTLRTDEEEAEVHRLHQELIDRNMDPGWTIWPREKL